MSGESGEKTELPTPKKERDAREKGQVARSQEVVTTVSLLAVVSYIWVTWDKTLGAMIRMMDEVAALVKGDFRTNALNAIDVVMQEATDVLLPLLGLTIVAGVVANYAQFGSVFAFENLIPKLEKLSPAAGFKRIFSMKQIVETVKSILKIVFLSVLLYFVVRDAIGNYVASLACGMNCLINVTSAELFRLLMYSGLAFIIVAVADFAYQKHHHVKSLMMTKEEVKREYKESEGDPHIKGKRKQLAQELVMSDGGNAARKGTAVVVNPTHLAVVIRYDPEHLPLPMVTAKGRNLHAHYLRTQAEMAGVPVFRNVNLARALYAGTEPSDFIPDELFDAIAEVLAWVARNQELLYRGPLKHGVIDMDAGAHRASQHPDAHATVN